MNLDLSNKNALVCGASAGIGKAAAQALAEMGANVTLMARNEAKLQSVLDTLDSSKGQTHSYLVADFTDPDNLKACIVKRYFSLLFRNRQQHWIISKIKIGNVHCRHYFP